MSPKRSGWAGYGKFVLSMLERSKSHPKMGLENFSDDEELAYYLGMRLRYWLREDKELPKQFRSAKKLHEAIEAIVVQVCD